MNVDGMKRLIWIMLGIFIAFVVLWLYADKLQEIEEDKKLTQTQPIQVSIFTEEKTNDIWEYIASQQAERLSTTTVAGKSDGRPDVTTEIKEKVTTIE
ncbi:hypothetical protein FACS1894132_10210 [Clostridia bacterium]|nr:hypothetical protein FACS1894132_10210 [Clostridia bacterium]